VPPVAFKDLCLDVHDAAAVGRFWQAAIGGDLDVMRDGDAVLRGDPLHALWLNTVPEQRSVKNRVHLDVRGSADELIEVGALRLADHDGWTVLGDPEGNELCAVAVPSGRADPAGAPPQPGAVSTVFALCVDSAEPVELAAWWHALVGGELVPGPDGSPRWLHGAAGLDGVTWMFVPVDDPRAAKNRMHWDVTCDDVEVLVAAGARVLRPRDDEISWTVLADPEGNEFCAFARR
jgi:hypothetical protein